jgi:hypothetical protein
MRLNRVSSLRLTVLAAALAGSTFTFAASIATANYAEPKSASYAAASGSILANALKGGTTATLKAALSQRGRSAATLATLRQDGDVHVGKDMGNGAVTHVRYEQVVDGLPVYGAYLRAAFDRNGNLIHMIDALADVPTSAVVNAKADASTALKATMRRVHPNVSATFTPLTSTTAGTTFDGGDFFYQAPSAKAVVVPMSDGTLAKGWLVETWSEKTNLLDHTLVGSSGSVLYTERQTATHNYNVFTVDPKATPQTIVSRPNSWLTSINLQQVRNAARQWVVDGNNVSAYLDVDNNNSPDGASLGDTMSLTLPLNAAETPSSVNNRKVALTNLFYLNNTIHDILYSHGFTETARNFQKKNPTGTGGTGGDHVRAEAQDGGGTNNANFASNNTDGATPRMQMYLWSGGGTVTITAPTPAAYQAGTAGFGPQLSPTATLSGAIAQASPYDACTTVGAGVAGKIALVQRGSCSFIVKVRAAQAAGATGVIVVNNATGFISMASDGSTPDPTIPAVMVSPADGAAILALASPTSTLSGTGPLDGDLDSGIVYHEYCHGLTWRMIGTMSGSMAGAIGEGGGDTCAMLVNGTDVMGTYANANPTGLRRFPYTNYPYTYSSWGHVGTPEVHNDGEIYGAIMWRLIQLFGDAGRSRLFDIFVDGMHYTPARPSVELMRDGMLSSLNTGGTQAEKCMVWKGFAQYGVGVGASGTRTTSDTAVPTIVESFTLPAECQ